MTVGELKEALSKYSDDEDVFVTIMGCDKVFRPKVSDWVGKPEITSDDEPDFADVIGIAEACLQKNTDLDLNQKEILGWLLE